MVPGIVLFFSFKSRGAFQILIGGKHKKQKVCQGTYLKNNKKCKNLSITTAGNEIFFSLLKRVKAFMRISIGDERLSSLMLMAREREEEKNTTRPIAG